MLTVEAVWFLILCVFYWFCCCALIKNLEAITFRQTLLSTMEVNDVFSWFHVCMHTHTHYTHTYVETKWCVILIRMFECWHSHSPTHSQTHFFKIVLYFVRTIQSSFSALYLCVCIFLFFDVFFFLDAISSI